MKRRALAQPTVAKKSGPTWLACKQLGIEIITAHSPEAKGRVERNHGLYQDRLVKELRLAGINEIAAANELLAGGFCEQLNRKFAIAPRSAIDYHRSA